MVGRLLFAILILFSLSLKAADVPGLSDLWKCADAIEFSKYSIDNNKMGDRMFFLPSAISKTDPFLDGFFVSRSGIYYLFLTDKEKKDGAFRLKLKIMPEKEREVFLLALSTDPKGLEFKVTEIKPSLETKDDEWNTFELKKPIIEKIALDNFRQTIQAGMYEKAEAAAGDLRLTGLNAHEGTRNFFLAAGRSEKFQKVWARAYAEAVGVGLDRNSAAIADFKKNLLKCDGDEGLRTHAKQIASGLDKVIESNHAIKNLVAEDIRTNLFKDFPENLYADAKAADEYMATLARQFIEVRGHQAIAAGTAEKPMHAKPVNPETHAQ